MSSNRLLIENLARQLPKIDVCGVCSVWDGQELNKTKAISTKESIIDSMFENVCSVWNDEENNKPASFQTIQTQGKQSNVCEVLGEESRKTAECKAIEEIQTIQTYQTGKNDYIHNEKAILKEEPLVLSNSRELSAYIDFYEERAAIYEFDASDVVKSRTEAQQLAMNDTLMQFMNDMKLQH